MVKTWRQCLVCVAIAMHGWALVGCPDVVGQEIPIQSDSGDADATVETSIEEELMEVPDEVDVDTAVDDDTIRQRLQDIYDRVAQAGWFDEIRVDVNDGVTTLSGTADSIEHKQWAADFARRTEDVVVVINNLNVAAAPFFDVQPALDQLRLLFQQTITAIPLLFVSLVIITLSYMIAKLAGRLYDRWSDGQLKSQLLRQVIRSVIVVIVMLLGLYVALKVSGLGRLAVTVLGGTGLIGLALGFAFRDIAENYLASILISLNRPFSVGDLIELENYKGFVRRVTTRGTILLTPEGNHVQIPNSTVYKSIITNHTASPKSRREFAIGIGYDDSITTAQRLVQSKVSGHPAVLSDPPPVVVVESLGASTVNLRVLFWVDIENYDPMTVTSAVMRQTKTVLIETGITMPDEAREIIFPNGVPVQVLEKKVASNGSRVDRSTTADHDPANVAGQNNVGRGEDHQAEVDAEGDLKNQSRQRSDAVDDGNLADGVSIVD